MTRCGVGMCVGKHRQTKHVPKELTFLLWKHQFRLAVWDEPRRAPSPAFLTPPAGLSTGGTTWLTALSLWHPDSQFWLPAPGHCHSWPAVCTDIRQQQQQMTRWDTGKVYSSFFLYGTLAGESKIKTSKKCKLPCIKGLFVNPYSLYAGSVFPTETKHYTYFACNDEHSLSLFETIFLSLLFSTSAYFYKIN